MKNKKQIIGWMVAAIVWMVIIFAQSNTPYQKQDIKPMLKNYLHLSQSNHLIEFYYDHELVSNKNPYEWVEFWVRKAGHVTEYAVLTFFLVMSIKAMDLPLLIKFLLPFAISFLYACTDEWHQTFVPNRTGHFIDVATFDLFGIVLVLAFFSLFRRKKLGNNREMEL